MTFMSLKEIYGKKTLQLDDTNIIDLIYVYRGSLKFYFEKIITCERSEIIISSKNYIDCEIMKEHYN